MAYHLIDTDTKQILRYHVPSPGSEELPANQVYLLVVDPQMPEFIEGQNASSEWIIDLAHMEYRRLWTIVEKELTPKWSQLFLDLSLSQAYQDILALTVQAPQYAGLFSVVMVAIESAIAGLGASDEEILQRFISSVLNLDSTMTSLGNPITQEQRTQLSTIFEANHISVPGFNLS